VPTPSLPPPRVVAGQRFYRRWRHFSGEQRQWWLQCWSDRLSAPKWQRRVTVHGLDKLTTALAARPVIVCPIHTTPVPTVAAWLRSMGIAAAHAPMDPTWFSSPARMRKKAIAERTGVAYLIRPRPRDMLEFLTPGHALVLTADFTGGRVTHVPWRGHAVMVATGLFRMARSTGAAVVPLLIFETGRWRYELTLFDAVPQEMIDAGDFDAAARYVVDSLYPPAAARPEQAMAVLIETIKPKP
jgi:lauroyl/myristoyl acyltransferase